MYIVTFNRYKGSKTEIKKFMDLAKAKNKYCNLKDRDDIYSVQLKHASIKDKFKEQIVLESKVNKSNARQKKYRVRYAEHMNMKKNIEFFNDYVEAKKRLNKIVDCKKYGFVELYCETTGTLFLNVNR